MKCTRRWANALVAMLMVGTFISCREVEPLAPLADRPNFAISDAVHGDGVAGFYFRSPMVPDVPLPGTFDPGLNPEVTVCEWDGTTCAALIAHFTTTSGPGAESVRANGDHYQVNWHARDYDLDPAKTYRIVVAVGGTELGFADVDVVANGRELKNVNTGEFIPLVEDRTLPIKFYIQAGTVAAFGPSGGHFVLADGDVEITVPEGLLQQPLGITVRRAPLDAGEYADAALMPGTTYDFGPDGTVFDAPGIRVTIHYDPANLGDMTPDQLTLVTQIDGLWADLGNVAVDESARTVSADLAHFTLVNIAAIIKPVITGPDPLNMVTGQVLDLIGEVGYRRAAYWRSSASTIVSVDTPIGPLSGRITARTPGTANIYLTTEDPVVATVVRADTLRVNVSAPGIGSLHNVTGGFNFTCGQDGSGVAYCWGQNSFGQLGDRTTTNRSTPVPVAGNLQYTTVVAGGAHACGLTVDGRAWCWGRNNFGQLGDNTLIDRAAPAPVMGDWRFALITAGDRHTCGFTLVQPTQPAALLCWGSNEWGQSGGALGGAAAKQPFALQVNPAGGVSSLDAGLGHTCAVIGGAATCWGLNSNGQLGDGSTTNSTFAYNRVQPPRPFRSISAGPAHTCAITTSDEAYCWGRNTAGQLGDNTTTDRGLANLPVSGVELWSQIDAGGSTGTTCALTTSASLNPDKLYCWGRNAAGNVGDGTNIDRAVPVEVSSGETFRQVGATGGGHVCATEVGGGGWCWGLNAFGQLGDNSLTSRNAPVQVGAFTVVPGLLPGSLSGSVKRLFLNTPLHTVRVSPTYGFPSLTDAQGAYALGPMIPGPTTLKLEFLPAGCVDPGINWTIQSGQNPGLLIQVPCYEIASVAIAPAAATLQVGTILTPVVTVRDNQGTVVPVQATFSTTGPISVTPTGQVTAQFVGSGVLTATASPAFGQSRITVQGGCAAAPVAGCVLTGHVPALAPYLRSVGAPAATTIEFTNAGIFGIKVFWLDYNGTPQPYLDLAPGQTQGIGTFTTHPWLVTNDFGTPLGVYVNPATTLARVIQGGVLPSYTNVRDNGFPLSSVWGSSASDVWAVGFGAHPLRYQGGTWGVVNTPTTPPHGPLNDVWGTGANDVYAVGWSGRIIHFDGANWSAPAPGIPDVFLNGVWGAGGRVYAVGSAGTIMAYDGVSWAPEVSNTAVQLQDVWAADANNVWAVGDGGVIVRRVGGVWVEQVVGPPTRSFRGVWGTSISNVYAVGQGGMIYRFDGSNWIAETSNTTQTLQAVGGTSTGAVVAIGAQGTYLRRTGVGGWVPQPVPSADVLEGIWFASSTDAVVVSSISTTVPQTGAILRGLP